MKTYNKVVAKLIGLILTTLSALTGSATNYTNNGTSTNYNLNTGDTLRILNGVYTGRINTFRQNAVIWVASNATFRPTAISNPQGTIINYGSVQVNFPFTVNSNFRFENYYLAQFNGYVIMNGPLNWRNLFGATTTFNGGLELNNSTTLYNESTISVTGNLAINWGSTFTNEFKINLSGNFSVNGGVFNNTGEINPSGTLTFNSGTSYTNSCRLVADSAFINNGVIQNNGLIWVRSHKPSTFFENNGTITGLPGSIIKSKNFVNNSTLNGSGSIYLLGNTRNYGNVGISTLTSDSLFIYDSTRTSPSTIFDIQYGSIRPNAVYRLLSPPDTVRVPSGCSNVYRTSVVLPMEWRYVQALLINNEPSIRWSCTFDEDYRFIIERSVNGTPFTAIGTVQAHKEDDYEYTDKGIDGSVRKVSYRIKAISKEGAIRYSPTRLLSMIPLTSDAVSVIPNPTNSQATVVYKSNHNTDLTLCIRDFMGRQLYRKMVKAFSGQNQFLLEEVHSLKPGMYLIDLIIQGQVIQSQKLVKQ